jgi:hypothetical protein
LGEVGGATEVAPVVFVSAEGEDFFGGWPHNCFSNGR